MTTKLSSFTKLALFTALYTLFFVNTSFAQTTTTFSTVSAAYCPYTFTKSLQMGSRDQEVKRLQQILNSDTRTVVAQSGVASPGNETDMYGAATRDAVKKFQALFIEYIGVANGVFGPKTRTVMNAVCNSEYYTSGKGQVYSGVTTQNTVNNTQQTTPATTSTSTAADTLAPAIYLRSNSTSINQGLSFRIIVTASEPIQAFTPESIIVEGGAVSDLRKLSPNSYSLLVTPNEGAKAVLAQVEADRVLDLAGNKNDNASNEIRIAIIPNVVTTATTTTVVATTSGITGGELDSIFNRILAQVTPATTSVAQATTCSNGATNPPTCNSFVNNYNQTPNYNSGSNSGQNQQNSLMNMLLMSKLLGGNNSGGGLFGNLFGGNKQPAGTGGQTGAGGTTTTGGGSSAADIQACANGDKTKCAGGTPADVPLPPKRPDDGLPDSGIVVREIYCEAIKTATGNIKCADGVKAYFVKEQDSTYEYVLIIMGKGKLKELKGGYKFVAGKDSKSANRLVEKEDYKICSAYDFTKNICTNEVYKSGTNNHKYIFADENNTSFNTDGDGKITDEFCKDNPTSDLCKQASQQPSQTSGQQNPNPSCTNGSCSCPTGYTYNWNSGCSPVQTSTPAPSPTCTGGQALGAPAVCTCPTGYTYSNGWLGHECVKN